MITKITGQLVALRESNLTLRIDNFEYEVLIPEFNRRQLQQQMGNQVSLHTIEYIEGNPMQGPHVATLDRLSQRGGAGSSSSCFARSTAWACARRCGR